MLAQTHEFREIVDVAGRLTEEKARGIGPGIVTTSLLAIRSL